MKRLKNKTASNWDESIYISESSYYNIEYYGVVEAEFEACYFENVLFYWNILSEIDFKNCTFVDCTFSGVAFLDCMFIKCHFKNCEFNQSNVGTECSSKGSLLIASKMDEKSSKNNPLTLYVDDTLELLTKSLKNELYKTFTMQRPELAVDVRGHCLACAETQETHETLLDLKQVTVNHFQLCYMTVESLSEDAFLYYMPRLLEFLLLGEENGWSSFISFFYLN